MKQARWSFALIGVALLAAGVIVETQQAGKVPRIGYLSGREQRLAEDRDNRVAPSL